MSEGRRIFAYIGRLLLSVVFFYGAFNYIIERGERVGSLYKEALALWQFSLGYWGAADNLFGRLIPYTTTLSLLAGCLQAIGAICLCFNVFVRLGSMLIIFYLIPNMLFFYPFWFFDGSTLRGLETFFYSELSLLGALFIVAAQGKGEKKRIFRGARQRDSVRIEE